MTIRMGDFNAKIGSDNTGYEDTMGTHGLGQMNENGERFANFCALNQLVIGGSIFPHKRIHKATWRSPDHVTENQIDHICISRKFRRSWRDVRVMRGADVSSDHHLLATTLRLRLKRHTNANNTRTRYNVGLLRNTDTQAAFRISLSNRFQPLQDLIEDSEMDIETHWEHSKKLWHDTCEEVLGKRKTQHKEWISADTIQKLEVRKEKKTALTRQVQVTKKLAGKFQQTDKPVSPFLFLLVIDWIMKTTTAGRKNGIQWTLWTQLDDLDFADDLALLSHSHSQMQDKTTRLEATSAGTGLKINRKKTELMKINTTANTPVTVGGEPIREVESFVYLGSVVDGQGGTDRDVTARIGKARAAMVMLKNVWASKVVSIRTKLRIFNSNVKSVLLYGCETWRTTKTMQQKIQTFLNTCLRRIFNIRWPEKIRNEELWERAGQEPVAKQILRRKWGWIGHTLRKPASSTTRQALTWNPQGKRKRGRPRNSWRRDTEAELCKQGTNWTGVARLAQNRVRWRRVVDGLCSTWSQGPK
nr:hypothetical protein BaRGS_012291 [Batillaria attramentaria]